MDENMTKDRLVEAAAEIMGGDAKELTIGALLELITVGQHVTDLCLNEIERRGELPLAPNGIVIVPYVSDYMVETVLTRRD